MYGPGVLLAHEERLACIRYVDDIVAVAPQDASHDGTHLFLVLHEEDCLVAASAART